MTNDIDKFSPLAKGNDRRFEKVCIVILNYNHADDTIELSNSLKRNLPANYFPIIVDNCSQDQAILIEYARTFSDYGVIHENDLLLDTPTPTDGLLILSEKNTGYAAGNNLALKYAQKHKFKIAFVANPDVKIQDFSIFHHFVQLIQKSRGKIAVVGPKLILPDGSLQLPYDCRPDFRLAIYNLMYPISRWYIRILLELEMALLGYQKVYLVIGCFFAVDLITFHQINFFDEQTFLYYEEQILAEKLRKIGKTIAYVPTASVLHNHSYEPEWALKNASVLAASKAHYHTKYLKIGPRMDKLIRATAVYQRYILSRRRKFTSYISKLIQRI